LYYLEIIREPGEENARPEKLVELCNDYETVKKRLEAGNIARFVVTEIDF